MIHSRGSSRLKKFHDIPSICGFHAEQWRLTGKCMHGDARQAAHAASCSFCFWTVSKTKIHVYSFASANLQTYVCAKLEHDLVCYTLTFSLRRLGRKREQKKRHV